MSAWIHDPLFLHFASPGIGHSVNTIITQQYVYTSSEYCVMEVSNFSKKYYQKSALQFLYGVWVGLVKPKSTYTVTQNVSSRLLCFIRNYIFHSEDFLQIT